MADFWILTAPNITVDVWFKAADMPEMTPCGRIVVYNAKTWRHDVMLGASGKRNKLDDGEFQVE